MKLAASPGLVAVVTARPCVKRREHGHETTYTQRTEIPDEGSLGRISPQNRGHRRTGQFTVAGVVGGGTSKVTAIMFDTMYEGRINAGWRKVRSHFISETAQDL